MISKNHLSHLLGLSTGFMASRIFLTALELNLFGQLGDQRLTSAQIAEQLHTDLRATEIMLNALVAMDVLRKIDGVYANLEETGDILISSGDVSSFRHPLLLWDIWSNLSDIVKTGTPCMPGWSDDRKKDVAVYMKHHAREVSDSLARMVDARGVRRMLDLGSGSGLHAIAFARQNPDIEIVLLDKDEVVLAIAQEEIAREHMHNRIQLARKDFFRDDIGSNYDLILLSSILCLFGEEENIFLLTKIRDILSDGGRVVILDRMLDGSKTKPLSSAIFSVHMLTVTSHGCAYAFSEVIAWLSSLGFQNVHRMPLGSSQVIIGNR